jgi:hypothetical protein
MINVWLVPVFFFANAYLEGVNAVRRRRQDEVLGIVQPFTAAMERTIVRAYIFGIFK